MADVSVLIDFLASGMNDSSGDMLSGYQVRTFASDGTTAAAVWEDRAKTAPTTAGKSSFVLTALGRGVVYGDNIYVIKLWTPTQDPDNDTATYSIGPVEYRVDMSNIFTGTLNGDIVSSDGTIVFQNGTDGTDASFTGTSTTATKIGDLNITTLDIDDWDMDATASVTVAHGLTLSKIRKVTGLIRNDAADTSYCIGLDASASSGLDSYISSIDATNVNIARRASSVFDDVAFNATSYNRGWVTIYYTD